MKNQCLRGKPTSIRVTTCRGMSLIEVMISIAILATVLTVLAANVSTLSVVRQLAKEEAIVQELLTGLAERVQGESLANLGSRNANQSHLNAWSWHRRMNPRWPETSTGVIPPMTEDTPIAPVPSVADATNVLPFTNYLLPVYDSSVPPQLISPGLLSQRSGIKDLKVYLEYYNQDVMLVALLNSTEPHKTWRTITDASGSSGADNSLVYSDDLDGEGALDLSAVKDEAILIRMVVTWSARDGGKRTRELTMARRQ